MCVYLSLLTIRGTTGRVCCAIECFHDISRVIMRAGQRSGAPCVGSQYVSWQTGLHWQPCHYCHYCISYKDFLPICRPASDLHNNTNESRQTIQRFVHLAASHSFQSSLLDYQRGFVNITDWLDFLDLTWNLELIDLEIKGLFNCFAKINPVNVKAIARQKKF